MQQWPLAYPQTRTRPRRDPKSEVGYAPVVCVKVFNNIFVGCYQCSRRRIDCDRQEPECVKCVTKGIKCSGLGLRYRFNDGIAARGKFVGKTFPVVDIPVTQSSKQDDATTAISKHQRDDPFRESGYERIAKSSVPTDEIADDTTETTTLVVPDNRPISIHWGLDHVDPKSRFCLGYCMSARPDFLNTLTCYSLQQYSPTNRSYQHGLQRLQRSYPTKSRNRPSRAKGRSSRR